jgi:hypothetical protein
MVEQGLQKRSPSLPARDARQHPAPGARCRRPREGLAVSGLVVTVAMAALAVRLWIAWRGGGIGGTDGYDDGVYYAASGSFLWGRLPYRDFVLLHPPGIMLALTPFALLGRIAGDHVGFEAARVAWMLVGALNATLVFRVCRRGGLAAATAGGLFYAVWTPAALTETTSRLEPLVTLGLLVALTLLSRAEGPQSRRVLLWVGAALAVSAGVKIWAVAPVVLVLLWIWHRAGWRAAAWATLGGLAAGVLVDGPFLVAAPTQMLRMVVLDQLRRGRTPIDVAARLAHVLVPGTTVPAQWSPGPATLVVGGLALALVCVACLGSGPGRFALSLLGVQVLVLLLSPSFFGYYNAYAAPGLALVVAQVVRWMVALLGHRMSSRAPGSLSTRAGTTLVLVLGIMLAVSRSLGVDSHVVSGALFPAATLERAASAARCVTSDSPDALILTDLFTRDLRRGCQVPVDLSGLSYDRDALPLRAVRRLERLREVEVGHAYALFSYDPRSWRTGARDLS